MASREYLVAKHWLADRPIELPNGHRLTTADDFASRGNWFGAGETYSQLERDVDGQIDPENRAKLLVRSATCFEIAGCYMPAARVFFDAANTLAAHDQHAQTAGEFYNRSARCYSFAGEHFSAGTAWMDAARMFERIGKTIVSSQDNIPPMPASAAGLTIAGIFFNAAGRAFLKTSGTEKNWATTAYWMAGEAYSRSYPIPNIQTFYSFKAALENGIRLYGSILPAKTRVYLPMSSQDREAQVDALKVMEDALFKSHRFHPQLNRCENADESAKNQTDEDLAAIFQEFALQLATLGHNDEASHFRQQANRRIEATHWRKRRAGSWLLYAFWRITSSYGESLRRWLFCTMTTILVFAALYEVTHSAQPTINFWDNLYCSVVTFTSLGYGDIHPSGLLGKFLASMEIGSGLIAFGILMSFISKRFSRS
ncbi:MULTISPECIES: potassium channel family protein [unclassified Mesorhizobium]|uniref:potassium channel family protein n=1 Tax=unclassified Mesorhizobium TaxID=325217 RepID=UPI000FCBD0F9|nr:MULTISPECIES: potassium channel family protein [unclassified Mesorhizobium]RUU68052.1 two pore domain potassium channel family protein [Mesorhizobium sp. M7A.T.Ca.TU.009.01.1.1]RUU84159.1 two pore domain potassium channel family protein [Mesorhizobium sp. M7A.T.Ca.TU.009.01.1.2]RUT84547.1 two pore domain potassium channel family protein [Mesorhizobium sp. M7A.T.Ca.US.000.02.1.1]RUT91728.1 two pore domain potassium channel family protein [Mesorhizobium sp. M7A.T.Ca.US.000.02.2.1]RUU05892.1 t